MPFQSEKQRRYLHANHPEIAKRWERDYANGGISNHFRKKFDKGSDYGQFERRQAHNVAAGSQAMNVGGGQGKQMYDQTMAKRKKNIKYYDKNLKSKFDTPTWDTDIISINLEDLKPKKTLDDYFNQLDETNVPLSDWEQKHMEELENQNRLEFEDEFKKKEGISNEKLMYPPPGNLAFKVGSKKDKQLKSLHKERALTKDLGIPFPAKKEKKYQKLLKEDQEQTEHPKSELLTAALGGVARKNYFHGGILDINESEEIISDDGNDIELTAYNAAFDDPNDLSTGVKSLFRAKNGGSYAMQGGVKNYLGNQEMVNAPKHWKSAPDHPDTELTYITKPEKDLLVKADLHGSLHGSVNKGPSDIISLNGWGDAGDFDGPSSSTGGGAPPGEKGGPGYVAPTRSRIQDERHEDFRQQQLKDIIATGPGSDEEKHDTDAQRIQDTVRETTSKDIHDSILDKHAHRFKSLKDLTLDQKARWAKDKYEDFKTAKGFMSIAAGPFGWLSAGKAVLDAEKRKKETLAELEKDIKTLTDLGYPTHHHTVDTLIQSLNQEILDMTQPKDQKDTGGDGPGPTLPKVVPVGEEIDAYAQSDYYMSPWERIKANQAKRAMLVEKGVIQENPIVDESVTDITMQANRGGLANLFRVKNQ